MTLANLVAALLALVGVPTVLAAVYLARLAIAARPLPRPTPSTRWRFDVIVPAHNEAGGIAPTLENLSALDYPSTQYRVIVVADNCTDDTAAVARAHGVTVLERTDTTQRGKGFALSHAFAWSAAEQWAEAVVVVDADSTLSPSSLQVIAGHLEAGAEAVQADYRVRNAAASWRTQLLELAFTLHHTVRSLGRTRRGESCGLRGNGMAFRHTTLARAPYAAYSLVEDIEYGIQLGMAGVAVCYAPDAEVRGEMPERGDAAARAQRARWELGRAALRAQWRGPLLRASLRGQPLTTDLLADLLVPPLATIALQAVLGFALAALLVWFGASPWMMLPWGIALAGLSLYGVRGLQRTSNPGAALRALAWAPVFVAWKLVPRRGDAAARKGEWVRTARRADS
jgi:1,2-diacylglycerol 3-beta-glucosyltransferase